MNRLLIPQFDSSGMIVVQHIDWSKRGFRAGDVSLHHYVLGAEYRPAKTACYVWETEPLPTTLFTDISDSDIAQYATDKGFSGAAVPEYQVAAGVCRLRVPIEKSDTITQPSIESLLGSFMMQRFEGSTGIIIVEEDSASRIAYVNPAYAEHALVA